MRLDTEFIRLPLDFDVDRLREEVLAVPEEAWRPHPQGNPGNWALPLIAVGGDPTDDSTRGAMAPTPHLAQLEYLTQVLAGFDTVLGRTRLMRLDGNTEATLHVDTNHYWAERVRVHVPIVTSPAIQFVCGDASMHMPAGQSWIFDAWRRHNVLNTTGDRRIHLVADTVGSSAFWSLVDRGTRPFAPGGAPASAAQLVAHRPGVAVELELEQHNQPSVISPWELETLTRDVVLHTLRARPGTDASVEAGLRAATTTFLRDWRAAWAASGPTLGGVDRFRRVLAAYAGAIESARGRLVLDNGSDPVDIAHQMLIRPALDEKQLAPPTSSAPAAVPTPQPNPPTAVPLTAPAAPAAPVAARPTSSSRARLDRPTFIVSPPRSGSSLLFETLAQSPSLWTIGGESHGLIESLPALRPDGRGFDSNRLAAIDAQPPVVEELSRRFLAELRDRDGNPLPEGDERVRLLEKTPKNALRVPFLAKAFPDARFVYLRRDPRETLSSMISAWESGRFVTYPDLPGWSGPPWSLVLSPEWRKLEGRPLAEIVAAQWRTTSEILLRELDALDPARVEAVAYDDLVADPQTEVSRLCGALGLDWDRELTPDLPLSRHTLTPPDPDKWRGHADVLEPVLPALAETTERGRALVERCTVPAVADASASATPSPFRSQSSASFPDILQQVGGSLLVSTYQTGKVVVVRALDGALNTHFRDFESPMGIAHEGGRLAIGTRSQIWELHNVPAITERMQPPGRHDACFVPRTVSYTGDIRVHDVGWVKGELWAVATRFSALVTLDGIHSFVPRWRPSFITGLAAEDRCHLNGMAIVNDEVRYVTALGTSDEAGGWRADRASGGVIIDVTTDQVVVSGLSMPHSPRWHRNRLWVLESGQGTLAEVDLESGTLRTVAELPGFTRGLAFVGNLAFIGLSEVREATTFGGLPLTGRLEERECGVWVVDIDTGKTVGHLRFEDLVEEIFDVCLLPGMRFPDLAEHGSEAVNSAFVLP